MTQKDTTFHPALSSFIGAVKSLVYRTILSQPLFVPFGEAVISTQTGKLLHADPILLPSGDLFLKIFYQNASLFNIQLKDIPNPTLTRFYLAPIGATARYIESTPTPQDSASFFDLLRFATGVPFLSNTDSVLTWGLFQIGDYPTPVSWPLQFVYTQPLHSSPAVDFSWFSSKGLMSEIESQINAMKTIMRAESQGQEMQATDLSKAGPNGKSGDSGFNLATTSDSKKQAGTSNVYPTPPDPSNKQRTEGDTVESTTWATPGGFGSEAWRDLGDELFGDEDRITEDDFKFFDDEKDTTQPSINHSTIPASSETLTSNASITNHTPSMNTHLQESSFFPSNTDSNIFSHGSQTDWEYSSNTKLSLGTTYNPSDTDRKSLKRKAFDFQIQERLDASTDAMQPRPKKRKTSVFSPLKFNSVILEGIDPKYSRGGRFFVPDPESDEDEDEEQEENQAQDEKIENDQPHSLTIANTSAEGPIDGLPTPDPLTHVMGSYQDAATPDWLHGGKKKADEENEATNMTSEWLQHFTINHLYEKDQFNVGDHQTEGKIGDSPDSEAIANELVEQIVWDDDLFDTIGTPRVYPEQPDQTIISLVTNVFPGLCKLSLLDAIYTSETQPSHTDDGSFPNISKHLIGEESTADHNGSLARTESDNGSLSQTEKSDMVATLKEERVFSISPPHFSFIRMEQVLKAKTPILRFWKVFGLNPRSGQKDITTFLIHPFGENLENICQSFLSMFKSSYESCGLGNVELASFNGHKHGSVPVPYKANNIDQMLEMFSEISMNFSRDLPATFKDRNIVVLLANPFTSISSLIRLSQICLQMNHIYTKFSKDPTCRLTCKIVPLSFFASRDSIVIPSQYKMVRFSLNVYDKCLPSGDHANSPLTPLPPHIYCQRRCPAFTLARTPPPRINFKLTSKPSPALLAEDSFIHIAYSLSDDDRWLVAAWSDQWGEISKVETFCLMKAGAPPKTFEAACGEIWEKTLAILACTPVQWRVALARIGSMGQEELEMWKRLSESSSLSMNTPYFLSVDLNPSLVITEDTNLFPHGSFQKANSAISRIVKDVSSGTPITPQRGMEFESPDTYMLNATPPGAETEKFEIEDVTIVDVKNDIYGLIFRNCVSPKSSYLTPSFKPLITGYLLKPGTPGEEQKLFEVTLMHCPNPAIMCMKNILLQYRGLTSISSFTGVCNSADSVAPWHIEAVAKALRALFHVT